MKTTRPTPPIGRFLRTLLRTLTLAVVACACALPAAAQDFPSRRVRLLIGQPPGGGSDPLMRLFADKLTQMWNQPVIVESLPGASGAIAMQALIKAPPDGYTLALLNFGNVVFVELTKNPPYVLDKDVTPIISVSRASNVLVIGPAVQDVLAGNVSLMIAAALTARIHADLQKVLDMPDAKLSIE